VLQDVEVGISVRKRVLKNEIWMCYRQASTQVEISTAGAYPRMTYLWHSTNHGGIVASCRGGVVRMSINVPINVRLNRGTAFSDNRLLTSWSMFNTDLCSVPGSLLYVRYESDFAVINAPVSIFHTAVND